MGSVIPALPAALNGPQGQAALGVYRVGASTLIGYRWPDGEILPVARMVLDAGEHLVAVTPVEASDQPQLYYLILAPDGQPAALVSAFKGNRRWQKWYQMRDHLAEFPVDADLRARLQREDELLALPDEVPFTALTWNGSLQPPLAEVNAYDLQGAYLGTRRGQLDWQAWVLRDADSGAEIAWYWTQAGHWVSLQDVPAGDWGPMLLARLQALENTTYGLGPGGQIMVVARDPAVVEYEANHVRVRDENAVGGWRIVLKEEAEAQGLEYEPLTPDVSQVEIADRSKYGLEGNKLVYDGQEAGYFEGDEFVFADPVTREEVWVEVKNLQWGEALVDDGVDKDGGLVNQRVVVRLEVMGEAPAGIEGEWVKFVFQEREWYAVPGPEGALAVLAGLEAGKSVADLMAEVRADLPDDLGALPRVDEAVLDIYLAQQARVWEKVKPYFEAANEVRDLSGWQGALVQRDGSVIVGDEGITPLGVVRVGDEVVMTMPMRWNVSQRENYVLMLNVLVSPEGQRRLVDEDGGRKGAFMNLDEMWQA